jgi:AraC-like DNA-binding protein
MVRATARMVTIHLPLQRGATYRVGRRTLRPDADTAVLLAPGHDYSVTSPPGVALAALLDEALLAREIGANSPSVAGAWSLRSIELPMSPAERAEFQSLVRRQLQSVSVAAHSRDFAPLMQVERELAGWLVGQLVRSRALKPLSASSRRAAELAEAWIRDHAAQPITLEQLAAAAGVSSRTLQKACLTRWGQTPLELVASRRLELVHSDLASQARALSVTEAAVRAGFTHLGRFAALYRRVYGQSPSDTLAQARQAPRAVA